MRFHGIFLNQSRCPAHQTWRSQPGTKVFDFRHFSPFLHVSPTRKIAPTFSYIAAQGLKPLIVDRSRSNQVDLRVSWASMKYEVELSADIWLGYIFFHLENGIFSLKTMISTDFSVLIDSSPNLLQMSLLGFILGFKVDLTWLSAVI